MQTWAFYFPAGVFCIVSVTGVPLPSCHLLLHPSTYRSEVRTATLTGSGPKQTRPPLIPRAGSQGFSIVISPHFDSW
jgi:hypothetical protein